jgi:transcription initiation factor TFIIIC subunit-like protein
VLTSPTQTYYLPVDFSISQFTRRNRVISLAARGGHHYRNWTGLEHVKKPEIRHHRLHSDDDDDDNNEPLLESDADEDDGPGGDEGTKDGEGDDLDDDADNNNGEPDELQILDLHSERPIFHYRKRTFEGSWSRILGTELLFTERTPSADDVSSRARPLPSIRSLPGDVDMLAATWSRISTREIQLHRRAAVEAKIADPLRDFKTAHGISIPIWSDKTGERANQTRFLEDLIALKMKRSEKDKVTVYAQAPEGNDRVSRGQRSRRRIYAGGRGGMGRGGLDGIRPPRNEDTPSLPLGHGDDEAGDEGRKRRRPLPDARPAKLRRPYGTGPYARKTRDLAALRAAAEEPDPFSESTSEDEDDVDVSDVVSVPTPERWADLEGDDDDYDETDSEEDYEDVYDGLAGGGDQGNGDAVMGNAS